MRKTLLTALCLLATSAHADTLAPDQYVDYASQLHCLNQQYWDDPVKLDDEIGKVEAAFGIDPDDFDAADALAARYDTDAEVQAAVEEKARELCPW